MGKNHTPVCMEVIPASYTELTCLFRVFNSMVECFAYTKKVVGSSPTTPSVISCSVAQSVEQHFDKVEVGSSSLPRQTPINKNDIHTN
jgi:hypothetical protein